MDAYGLIWDLQINRVGCLCSARQICFLGDDTAGSNLPPEEASTSRKRFSPVLQ